MAELADLREALAANLAGVSGLTRSAYVLSNPTPPCAEIEPAPVEYDLAMHRGLDRWRFTVRVYVAANLDKGAQKRLDGYLASSGADSIKAALESDRTLAGAADDLRVTGCTGYRAYERGGQAAMLGAEWQVEVLALGA